MAKCSPIGPGRSHAWLSLIAYETHSIVTLLGCECGMMLCEQTAQCTTSCRMLSLFYLHVACRWQWHPVRDTSCNPPMASPGGGGHRGHTSSPGTPNWISLAAQSIDCTSQTANKSPSEVGSKPDSQADLFLPASGLPPIPGHLVQAIKDRKFVDLATYSQRHCKRPNLTGLATKRTTPRRKGSTQSLHQWTGWCP